MPKANHGGATAAGMTGIVEHGAPLADGRTLSELDPEVNLDGTLIEGEHPDHPKAEEREEGTVHAGPDTLPRPIDDPYEVVHDEDDDDSNEKPTDSEDKPKPDEKPAEADDSRSDVRSAPAKTPAKEEEGVPFPGSSSATLSKSTASTRGTSSKRR